MTGSQRNPVLEAPPPPPPPKAGFWELKIERIAERQMRKVEV
jgi:hypothetical protein